MDGGAEFDTVVWNGGDSGLDELINPYLTALQEHCELPKEESRGKIPEFYADNGDEGEDEGEGEDGGGGGSGSGSGGQPRGADSQQAVSAHRPSLLSD